MRKIKSKIILVDFNTVFNGIINVLEILFK